MFIVLTTESGKKHLFNLDDIICTEDSGFEGAMLVIHNGEKPCRIMVQETPEQIATAIERAETEVARVEDCPFCSSAITKNSTLNIIPLSNDFQKVKIPQVDIKKELASRLTKSLCNEKKEEEE